MDVWERNGERKIGREREREQYLECIIYDWLYNRPFHMSYIQLTQHISLWYRFFFLLCTRAATLNVLLGIDTNADPYH